MNEAPLGTFEEHVLVALIRTREDSYGMAVRRLLEEVTGRDVAVGAVYATLDRLEAKGFVHSTRADREGVSRRLFFVTSSGARALESSRAMRERLWHGVNLAPLLARG